MPIYEYECANCGWKGDRMCSMADRDAQICGNRPTDEVLPGLEPGPIVNAIRTQTEAERERFFKCDTKLVRDEIPRVTIDTKGSFEFGMDFGRGVVKGHHKDAPLKRPTYSKP